MQFKLKTQHGLNFNAAAAAARPKIKLAIRPIILAGDPPTADRNRRNKNILINYSHLYFDQHIDTRNITNGTAVNCLVTKKSVK